jgi:hypothetical protein
MVRSSEWFAASVVQVFAKVNFSVEWFTRPG